MPYVEKPRYESANQGDIHQPVVICIDTSGSMSDDPRKGAILAEDGRAKAKIVEEMVNSLVNIDLSENEKASIDICIMVFDDDCRVIQDWIPLSWFNGDIRLDDVAGCTALGTAVIDCIDATRAIRRSYNRTGITARRAQIFLYTDGETTENMDAATRKVREYLDRDRPSAKMYAILMPPASNPKDFVAMSNKITVLRAADCVHGIPKSFKFLKDSIVAWSSSSPTDSVKVPMRKEPGDTGRELAVLPGSGGVKKENGVFVVEEDNTEVFEGWEFIED